MTPAAEVDGGVGWAITVAVNDGDVVEVLLVPDADPIFDDLRDLDDVAPVRRRELEQFFDHYKDLSPGRPRLAGWGTRATALEEISAARGRASRRSVRRVAEA